MSRPLHCALLVLACLAAGARADEASNALAQARRQCAGDAPALRADPQLQDAAARLARGARLADALKASGFRSTRSYEWQLTGYPTAQGVARDLAAQHCAQLGRAELTHAAVHREGNAWWIVAAAAFTPPAAAQSDEVARRVLDLVNQARVGPRQCGDRSFPAAIPLRLDPVLTRAAATHADAMAQGGFLEHEGRDGSTPAQRATRAGYDWRNIGENIASGQVTPERVVQDWLASPRHCANIMERAFTEMGIAFAVDRASEGGIYWAQAFGRPRAASR